MKKGWNTLGQIGNDSKRRIDLPPEEYLPMREMNRVSYKKPKPYMGKAEPNPGLAALETGRKDERRQAWLKKKAAGKRGLRQLNMGG